MGKWDVFESIPPECWSPEIPPGGAAPIWRLPPDWTAQFYPGVYHAIARDGDPFANEWRICCFEKAPPSAVIEVTVHSRRTQTPEYYNFPWNVRALPEGAVAISRYRMGRKSGAATLKPGGSSPYCVRIESPEIEEDMLVDLRTLQVTLAETGRERRQRLEPWVRILLWYGRLQQIDPEAFARIPWPVQCCIRGPAFERAAQGLSEERLSAWQEQKLMPAEIAWLWEREAPEEIGKMELLQSLVRDPHRLANPIHLPNVPMLVRQVNARSLDLLDLKVFMTIGALRERWGYKAREWNKLLERRPELRAMCETPQGQKQAEFDPEWQMIRNHPLAQQEDDDEMEAWQHRRGDHGPSVKERLRASDIQMQQMMNRMAAQERHTAAMLGMVGVPGLPPLPVPDLSNPYLRQDPPPAWKIYRPYMI